MPDFLYKYRSMGEKVLLERLRETVVDSLIYLSSPKELNDPFDCRPFFEIPVAKEEQVEMVSGPLRYKYRTARAAQIRKMAEEFLRAPNLAERIQQANEAFRSQEIEKIGVYCFSAIKDSTVMFSHYADSHRGICLEFDVRSKKHWEKIWEMHYSEAYPVIQWSPKLSPADSKKLFHWKDVGWKYEGEYRLIHNKQGHLTFPPDHLTGIIFGCLMSEKDKEIIKCWLSRRKPQIQLYETTIHPSQYKLIIQKTK